jgi:hypothetical protein
MAPRAPLDYVRLAIVLIDDRCIVFADHLRL